MRLPAWLLKYLPLFEYICPKCRNTVKANSHKCVHCGENYPLALKIPPSFLKDPKKLESYVHKHVFPRVSKFERDYLTQFFTVFITDGFEAGLGAWTLGHAGGSADPVQSAVAPLFGSWCMKCDASDAGNISYATQNFAAMDITYARVYVKTDTLPEDGFFVYFLKLSDGATDYAIAAIENDGGVYKWYLENNGGATFGEYESTISINTWYCVELLYDYPGNNDKLYINGSEVISFSPASANPDQASQIMLCGQGVASVAVYLDNVVVADAHIGPTANPNSLVALYRMS